MEDDSASLFSTGPLKWKIFLPVLVLLALQIGRCFSRYLFYWSFKVEDVSDGTCSTGPLKWKMFQMVFVLLAL